MEYRDDTISAISTPIGIGGIAVLRISGNQALPVVDEIFRSKKTLASYPSHKAIFGRICNNQKLIDEVLVTIFNQQTLFKCDNSELLL